MTRRGSSMTTSPAGAAVSTCRLTCGSRAASGAASSSACRTSDTAERPSYAEIAAAARSPRAVRAVGSACAANPLPLILPCHRVVRGDGTPGGYVGGPEVKLRLLDLERAAGRQP